MNLSYRFVPDQPSRRDIDDPSVVLFRDNYFLFASKAGGYWSSPDLVSWKFITSHRLPFENQGPAAFVIDDWLYFATSDHDTIYRSNDPASGKWESYSTSMLLSLISDFTIFVDSNGRVYCYYGCTNNDGVMMRELDAKNRFEPIGTPVVCRLKSPLKNGKSKNRTNLDKYETVNIKGSWMNKYNGKYYYQCAVQNPEFGNYYDAVYVSDKPSGPFVSAANNPFSYRPDGFVSGAGNGSTFTDKYGNWWHIATMVSSGKNGSKARLGLFPAGFDKDGHLFARTDFGDFPIILPKLKYSDPEKLYSGWSLLSFNKTGQASSNLAIGPVSSAFDENINTFWSAQSGRKGEYLKTDLGLEYTINAIQLNFAENNTRLLRRDAVKAQQYLVEYSTDNKIWKMLIDKTTNTEDLTHPYFELKTPVQAQYLRVTNYRVPDGTFAISGFRIFGTGTGKKPKKVGSFRGVRDPKKFEITKLFWQKQNDVTGYNIRYGIQSDKLYHSYQVFSNSPLKISCPDKNKTYWFQIDAFNENGVTPGKAQQTN
ncbi:MAG: discoidin domain-containing protein [Prolixibacteraceae bacterium]